MTPPRTLWRVEWTAARHPDRPNDRREQSRNFATAENAGAQVAAIRLWSPKFMELHGVWKTTGGRGSLDWHAVDPDSLPVNEMAAARYRSVAESPMYAEMMEDQ